jgi:hypothetical protein
MLRTTTMSLDLVGYNDAPNVSGDYSAGRDV